MANNSSQQVPSALGYFDAPIFSRLHNHLATKRKDNYELVVCRKIKILQRGGIIYDKH
ncbi:MAG: hypothetical protein LBI79_10005 [Nitrososphaerota archaeon]|jgi:hypothetical protein|nr:hypothetical protein [Nitrososphaerota archaeon]